MLITYKVFLIAKTIESLVGGRKKITNDDVVSICSLSPDFLIWNLDEGDKPGGTLIELALAWYRGIPVYLITQIPKTHINKSILFFVLDSGNEQGAIFPNQKQLLEFLDKKYKLKRRKNE